MYNFSLCVCSIANGVVSSFSSPPFPNSTFPPLSNRRPRRADLCLQCPSQPPPPPPPHTHTPGRTGGWGDGGARRGGGERGGGGSLTLVKWEPSSIMVCRKHPALTCTQTSGGTLYSVGALSLHNARGIHVQRIPHRQMRYAWYKIH